MHSVMRPTRVLVLTGLSLALLGTASADIESSFDAGYTSDYIFRGGDVGNNLFDLSLDFSGSGEVGGLGALDWSAGIWLSTFSVSGSASNNELDIYGEVSKSLNDMFSVAAGITNYTYFGNGGAAEDDIEPYLSIGANIGVISLGAAAHYDGANNYGHDLYWEFTAAYEREVCDEQATLGLQATVGVFDDSVDGDADVFFGGTVALKYAVSDNVTVTPHVNVTFSEDLGDHFFGGVNVGFGF